MIYNDFIASFDDPYSELYIQQFLLQFSFNCLVSVMIRHHDSHHVILHNKIAYTPTIQAN